MVVTCQNFVHDVRHSACRQRMRCYPDEMAEVEKMLDQSLMNANISRQVRLPACHSHKAVHYLWQCGITILASCPTAHSCICEKQVHPYSQQTPLPPSLLLVCAARTHAPCARLQCLVLCLWLNAERWSHTSPLKVQPGGVYAMRMCHANVPCECAMRFLK